MPKTVAKRPNAAAAPRRPAGHPGEKRGAPAVTALASDYRDGASTGWHSHRRAQLAFAVRGVMHVDTEQGAFVVPPQRAVWLPAGVEHRIDARGSVAMRTVYVEAADAADAAGDSETQGLPTQVRVLHVTRLLRELILAVSTCPGPTGPTAPKNA